MLPPVEVDGTIVGTDVVDEEFVMLFVGDVVTCEVVDTVAEDVGVDLLYHLI